MQAIPNVLSILRIPLAFLFLIDQPAVRLAAIAIAMITDGLDGYLARKMRWISRTGTLIDPLTDRFFVIFAIAIFIQEGMLNSWQTATLLCRDISVILFGIYLLFTHKLSTWRFRAIWCGKATTFFQFLLLVGLTIGVQVNDLYYTIFVILGLLALVELYLSKMNELSQ